MNTWNCILAAYVNGCAERENESARAVLFPALRAVLGDDAEVVAVGQIAAMSPGWELLDIDSLGDQRWHTDGRGSALDTDALTVFIPLCDLTDTNGPTEFILGSHRDPSAAAVANMSDEMRAARATTLHLPRGSAVAFDYRLWHRGRQNNEVADRPVLYAIVGRPVWRAGGLKGVPVLDRGSSTSLLTGATEVPAAATFLVGAPLHADEPVVNDASPSVRSRSQPPARAVLRKRRRH